jgi:hypothetical protein
MLQDQPPVQHHSRHTSSIQFMAVAHYGYLVLKMPSPNGILKIRGDRDAGVCVLEKLQVLAAAREATEELGG